MDQWVAFCNEERSPQGYGTHGRTSARPENGFLSGWSLRRLTSSPPEVESAPPAFLARPPIPEQLRAIDLTCGLNPKAVRRTG